MPFLSCSLTFSPEHMEIAPALESGLSPKGEATQQADAISGAILGVLRGAVNVPESQGKTLRKEKEKDEAPSFCRQA